MREYLSLLGYGYARRWRANQTLNNPLIFKILQDIIL